MDAGRPKSHTGDYNIKRRFSKGFRNSKKSMMIFSNHKKEDTDVDYEESLNGTPHRSCSLNALHTGQVLLQPRMAQLETLEAKMARIENSLSTTPRKKKITSSNNSISSALVVSNTNLTDVHLSPTYDNTSRSTNLLKSISTFPKSSININGSANNALIYKTSKDIAREMEALKNALRAKENVIDNLKGQLTTPVNFSRSSTTYLQAKQKNDQACNDKQVAEERLLRLKQEMENKTMIIKNIKLELERLDITDNIDIRIQQAELEYQLGREELDLLSISEEIQGIKIVLKEQDVVAGGSQCGNTLFNHIHKKHSVTLHSSEIMYDAKSPRFGASNHENTNMFAVDWATEDSGLMKGDFLLEINGKLTLSLRSHEDMIRLLSVSPNPAQIVVMRHHKTDVVVTTLYEELDAYREKAGEAERIRDSFRSDNVRLTHRISYLEEQVADLLARASKNDHLPTAVKASFENHSNGDCEPQIQIFQKGSKVTLIGNVPSSKNSLKIRDTLPTVSNKLRNKVTCRSMDGLESSRLSESISSLPVEKRVEGVTPNAEARSRSICYMNYQSPSSLKNKENYCAINERRLRYIKEAQNSLMNQRHFKDDRSCKSVDFDSEPNYQSLKHLTNGRLAMYDSETSSDYSRAVKYPRPIPPQKPLRLSLHKGCSLQSVKIIDKSNGDIELKKNHSAYENTDKKTEKWC